MTSIHYCECRKERERKIRAIGEGTECAEKIVDRGHPNGAERHVLTTTGIIIVYNARTGILVTKLIARPGQVKRFFADGIAPAEILRVAYIHQQNGLNY